MSLRLLALPGDGIGPEVTEATLSVLRGVCAASGGSAQAKQAVAGFATLRPGHPGQGDADARIDAGVHAALADPATHTPDLGAQTSTHQMAHAIVTHIEGAAP